MTTTFDYVQFINEGFDAQQKYASKVDQPGPLDSLSRETRHAKVIEHMSHLIEEVVEARVFVPRRSWKQDEPSFLDNEKLRKEFIAEMFDQLLFHRAILAYAGVTGEEFAEIAGKKMEYNKVRPDHVTNGNVKAEADPLAELHGFCPSSDFDENTITP
jgi:hypothetical protein